MSEVEQKKQTSGLPYLSKKTIWMINFGFLGVQTAFTLQSSQMSRIFQTIGADPNSLGWFFILPPLMGMIVQPIVGYYSDRTWAPKLGGRRLPYLMLGTIVAVIVMLLLPNSGSLGFGYGSFAALMFGAITVAFLDLSSNVAMQPFKMMVGDMVNDDQKSYAYGIQSLLNNIGSVLAAIFPFLLTWFGLQNTAPKGVVPPSVRWAFYIGAILLICTSALTMTHVKEYDPETYAKYHGIKESDITGLNCSSTLPRPSGRFLWYNSSAGLLSNTCGLTPLVQLLKTYGTRPTQVLPLTRLLVTGTV